MQDAATHPRFVLQQYSSSQRQKERKSVTGWERTSIGKLVSRTGESKQRFLSIFSV